MRPTLEQVYAQNASKVARLSELLRQLSSQTGLEASELLTLLKERQAYVSVPAEILNCELSPLEAVAAYLSCLGYTPTASAKLLGRHASTIWATVQNAEKKMRPAAFRRHAEQRAAYRIPLSVFAERNLSILERAASHLQKEYGLSPRDIARILGRHVRTIWTVLGRARKKPGTTPE